jgi:hypothetical protein
MISPGAGAGALIKRREKMPKYRVLHQTSDDGWCDWQFPVMKGYKLACCDCGLVHDVEFRVVKRDPKTGMPMVMDESEYRVELRMRRNNRATGQVRRWDKTKSNK